jgi:hypothetical protein
VFTHVRKSRLAIPAGEAVQRTCDQIVPMLKKQPGFLGYYGFVEGEEAVATTLCDAPTAARANDAVRETVGRQEWISGESEVLHGRVVFGANPGDLADRAVRARATGARRGGRGASGAPFGALLRHARPSGPGPGGPETRRRSA